MGGIEFSTLYHAQQLTPPAWCPTVVCPTEGDLPRCCRAAGVEVAIVPGARFISTSTRVGEHAVANPFALAGAPVLAAGVPAIFYIPAANLPAVTTRTLDVRLTGKINVTRAADIRVFYEFQRLKSTDYAYDGMQFGTGTEQLPTLELAPNYTVHVVGLTFGYRY